MVTNILPVISIYFPFEDHAVSAVFVPKLRRGMEMVSEMTGVAGTGAGPSFFASISGCLGSLHCTSPGPDPRAGEVSRERA